MRKLYATTTLLLFLLLQYQASAQVLNKMRQKLEQTTNQALDKALGTNSTSNPNTGPASSTNSSRVKPAIPGVLAWYLRHPM